MTTQTFITPREIPLRALQFTAAVGLEHQSGTLDTVPVTITARSGEAANHWYWGNVIHDLSGMRVAPSIPIDYEHSSYEALGFADKFEIQGGALVIRGQLTPFREDDRAVEIATKSKKGVPYEASIFFDPFDCLVEEIRDGQMATVNGVQFNGPGFVVREWTLRGVAICLYGTDQKTSVQFGGATSPKVSVRLKEVSQMSTATPATPAAAAPAPTPTPVPTETTPANTTTAAAGTAPAVDPNKPVEKTVVQSTAVSEAAKESPLPATGSTQLSAAAVAIPGTQYIAEFGQLGAVWFAEGKSYDEARGLFAKHQASEIERLTKANSEMSAKLKLAAGEQAPVGFSAALTPEQEKAAKERTAFTQKTGSEGIGRFAASIKLPGQN